MGQRLSTKKMLGHQTNALSLPANCENADAIVTTQPPL